MIKKYVKVNKYYLIFFLLIILLMFFVNKYSLFENIDNSISDFVIKNVNNAKVINIFHVITYLGSARVLIIITLLTLAIENRDIFDELAINLSTTYLISYALKKIFRRERPSINLIKKPKDFSFPSGHTMCSVSVYGYLIYAVNKYLKNKKTKVLLTILLSTIMFLVMASRIILNVHYFSDVLFGFILSIILLKMFINYDRI